MKVSELTGAQLDYWVAKGENRSPDMGGPELPGIGVVCRACLPNGEFGIYSPSYDWRQGGPIVESQKIALEFVTDEWEGIVMRQHDHVFAYGDSALIAAMRAYVASKFGKEVDTR